MPTGYSHQDKHQAPASTPHPPPVPTGRATLIATRQDRHQAPASTPHPPPVPTGRGRFSSLVRASTFIRTRALLFPSESGNHKKCRLRPVGTRGVEGLVPVLVAARCIGIVVGQGRHHR